MDKWDKTVPSAAEGKSKPSQKAVSNSTDDMVSFNFSSACSELYGSLHIVSTPYPLPDLIEH